MNNLKPSLEDYLSISDNLQGNHTNHQQDCLRDL